MAFTVVSVVMVLKFVSLGGLERLVRYLSSAAHFNLQTCIWNILECCSFRSLIWSCWGFPVNQSASEFPVRSLDCKILHDLQSWKEAEHCFWMKGEIGCTWWSALLSALHIEDITTRKRFWRGPSISTQMTLIATQSNNWSIYRVYALCFWYLWCEDFRFFFSIKSGLIVFSWIQAAELLLDSWQQCAGLNTSGITEKGNVWFDLVCPGDELTMNWCFSFFKFHVIWIEQLISKSWMLLSVRLFAKWSLAAAPIAAPKINIWGFPVLQAF